MRVALCMEAVLFREALATVVTARGHQVVYCLRDLADAAGSIERSTPDVVLLDASLAVDGFLVRLGARRDRSLTPRVLLVASAGEESAASAIVDAGLADGVLHHAVPLATLERALTGQSTWASEPRSTVAQPRHVDSLLTGREFEVIGLLLAGRSNGEIAVALGVSRSTVHSHVRSILRKLGAQSRVQAVSIYLGEMTAPTRPVD
jgi:DNA-binding NarL/FixJ family response regulator